ncbi:putative Abi-like protein [Magnetospirillum sp. LM-5]|nr:putative Abi-like protein [Magnetospirillum sp. LM-5]
MHESREPYLKQPLAPAELVALLRSRGLEVGDESRLTHYLTYIGYFRLSGYFPPFQVRREDGGGAFRPGTTFSQILDLYVFDRKVRLLLIDALERIEVAIRTVISDKMSLAHGAFWLNNDTLFDKPHHPEIVEQINASIDLRDGKTHHAFLKHYSRKYANIYPPSWMVFETLSFGQVSHIYKRLRGCNQKLISDEFGLDNAFFESWLHVLWFSRNVVAHHSRVWNRVFTIQPKIPRKLSEAWPREAANRFYGLCVMINYLMDVVADGSRWPDRLRSLLMEYPEIPLAQMGFPEGWTGLEYWKRRFSVAEDAAVLCPLTNSLCYTPNSD